MSDNVVDAGVEDYFARFDNEEENLVDYSDSSSEQEDTSDKSPDPAVKEEEKEDTSKTSKSEADSEEQDSDENTPFHKHPRWQEKQEQVRKLKERDEKREKEFQELQDRLEKLEYKPLTDEEIENMSPKEAMEYARKEAEREFNKNKLISEKEEKEAERYIEETLSELRDEGNEFDENELLKIAEDFTDGDLKKAHTLYEKLNQNKEAGAKQAEKSAAKRKAAESKSGNKGNPGKSTGFVSGTGWDDLSLT